MNQLVITSLEELEILITEIADRAQKIAILFEPVSEDPPQEGTFFERAQELLTPLPASLRNLERCRVLQTIIANLNALISLLPEPTDDQQPSSKKEWTQISELFKKMVLSVLRQEKNSKLYRKNLAYAALEFSRKTEPFDPISLLGADLFE